MIPLFKPYMPAKLPDLDRIIQSGQLAYGKYAREFEARLAEYIGIDEVLCTSSYNSAYLVLIRTLGLGHGDEVVASPMCCLASSQPFAVNGIKLIWADIDPSTGTLDPEAVKSKITPRTRAIVHNHFCGYAGHVGEMRKIADEHGLMLIDDVSEAFGTEYHGRKAGNWDADATVYSFQTVRLPNAIDGGAVSFKDPTYSQKAALLRDYGIDRARFRDDLGEISPLCDISEAAYGCLSSDVNAYIGMLSLADTPELLRRQRENAVRIAENLPDGVEPLVPLSGTNPNYWVFGALACDKRGLIADFRAAGTCGISGVHLPNTYYSLFGDQGVFSGVEEFNHHFVALPCGWWISDSAL